MSALDNLIETITKDPQLAFVQRTKSCYGKFLQLYKDAKYRRIVPATHPPLLVGWEHSQRFKR